MKASKITEAELVILSLVAEKPVYGYEIEQIIQQRGMREWTAIGFSSIYYLLKKIENKGWIVGNLFNSTKQGLQRTIYSLTDEGLKSCREATLQALSIPHAIPNDFLTALLNLPLLTKNQIQQALSLYRNGLTAKIKEMEIKKENQSVPLPEYVNFIFDYSIHSIQCELKWIESIQSRLGNSGFSPKNLKRNSMEKR